MSIVICLQKVAAIEATVTRKAAFPEVFSLLRCTFFAKMRNVFLHRMHEMCRNVQFFS